jgi:predicted metalloendopeptidase
MKNIFTGFTSNVQYMTPNMAIMKLKQHNLKVVYPTVFVYDTLQQVQSQDDLFQHNVMSHHKILPASQVPKINKHENILQ